MEASINRLINKCNIAFILIFIFINQTQTTPNLGSICQNEDLKPKPFNYLDDDKDLTIWNVRWKHGIVIKVPNIQEIRDKYFEAPSNTSSCQIQEIQILDYSGYNDTILTGHGNSIIAINTTLTYSRTLDPKEFKISVKLGTGQNQVTNPSTFRVGLVIWCFDETELKVEEKYNSKKYFLKEFTPTKTTLWLCYQCSETIIRLSDIFQFVTDQDCGANLIQYSEYESGNLKIQLLDRYKNEQSGTTRYIYPSNNKYRLPPFSAYAYFIFYVKINNKQVKNLGEYEFKVKTKYKEFFVDSGIQILTYKLAFQYCTGQHPQVAQSEVYRYEKIIYLDYYKDQYELYYNSLFTVPNPYDQVCNQPIYTQNPAYNDVISYYPSSHYIYTSIGTQYVQRGLRIYRYSSGTLRTAVFNVTVQNQALNLSKTPIGDLQTRQVEISFKFADDICSNERITTQSSFPSDSQFTKNTGYQNLEINFNKDFHFNSTYHKSPCNITEWKITNSSSTELPIAGDVIYTVFKSLQGNQNNGKIIISTNLQSESDSTIEARLWITLGIDNYKYKHQQPFNITVTINCKGSYFKEDLNSNASDALYFKSYDSGQNVLYLYMPKTLNGTEIHLVNLQNFITFARSDYFCPVYKFRSYSSLDGNMTNSTSLVKLKTNPTERNNQTKSIEPIIQFDISQNQQNISTVYITAENSVQNKTGMLTIKSEFCDLSPKYTTIRSKNLSLFVGSKFEEVDAQEFYTMQKTPLTCQGIDLLISSNQSIFQSLSIEGVSTNNSHLQIKPLKVMKQRQFYLFIRNQKSFEQINVSISLEVYDCSDEQITPLVTNISFDLKELQSPSNLINETEISKMFSLPKNTNCNVSDWVMSSSRSYSTLKPDNNLYNVFMLQKKQGKMGNLQIDPTKRDSKAVIESAYLFAYIGITKESQRMIETPIQILIKYDQSAIKKQQIPYFKTKPNSEIQISATYDKTDSLKEPVQFMYRFPQIIDPQNRKISKIVDWKFNSADFATIEETSNTISVIIDRSKITEENQGIYFLSVQLGNDIYPPSLEDIQTFSFIVKYKRSMIQQPDIQPSSNKNSSEQTHIIEQQDKKDTSNSESNNQQSEDIRNSNEEIFVPVERGGQTKKPLQNKLQQSVSQEKISNYFEYWKKDTKTQSKQFLRQQKQLPDPKFDMDFKRDGNLDLNFNQEILIPPFILASQRQQEEKSTQRKLLTLSQIDVTRNLFDIEFDFYNDIDQDQIQYTVNIEKWTENQISLFFNFTDPMLISQGNKYDKVFIKVKDNSLIKSKATGKSIDTKNVPEFVSIVPKQVPSGMKLSTIVSAVKTSSNSVLAIMIVQIFCQLILKGSVKAIIGFYLCIQQIVYIIYFNIKIAAPVEMLLHEFKKLIEFKSLNIENFVQMWDPEFRVSDWITGIKERVVSEDQGKSFLNELQVYLIAGFGFLAFLLALYIFGDCFSKLRVKLKKILKKTFFNGLIMTLQITCFKYCIVIGNQVRMNSTKSRFSKQSEYQGALCTFIVLNIINFIITFTLIWNYNKLDSQKMRDRFGNMYIGCSFKRDYLMIFKFPLSIIQRQVYMLLAGYFYLQPYFSLIIYIFVSLFYTMYCFNYKIFGFKIQQFQQMFTEGMIHMIILLLFLFTDFVTVTETMLIYSYVYMGVFGFISFVNIMIIIYNGILSCMWQKKMKQIKKQKEKQFKEWLEKEQKRKQEEKERKEQQQTLRVAEVIKYADESVNSPTLVEVKEKLGLFQQKSKTHSSIKELIKPQHIIVEQKSEEEQTSKSATFDQYSLFDNSQFLGDGFNTSLEPIIQIQQERDILIETQKIMIQNRQSAIKTKELNEICHKSAYSESSDESQIVAH